MFSFLLIAIPFSLLDSYQHDAHKPRYVNAQSPHVTTFDYQLRLSQPLHCHTHVFESVRRVGLVQKCIVAWQWLYKIQDWCKNVGFYAG